MTTAVTTLVLAIRLLAPGINEDRARDVARQIAAVEQDPDEQFLMAVTAHAESGFRLTYEKCHKLHDHGQGWTMWALHESALRGHSATEACSQPVLAAWLAKQRLATGGDVRARIASYMGRAENDAEVERRYVLWQSLRAQVAA